MSIIYSGSETTDVIGGKLLELMFWLAAVIAVRSFQFLCVVAEQQYDRNKFLCLAASEIEAHRTRSLL
ncbi:MAG: hypothetical protein GY847_04995 [Proteobacteria bacterium]|nr:hypothetical protein [Pseudomonadota bacterium]